MRFYGFGNYYLSGLQQALQASHVIGDISVQYPATSTQNKIYREWAKKHKTIILLNGGNSASLLEIYNQLLSFKKRGMTLPFSKFHEDEQSLNQALTSVGIVVPEKYYEAASQLPGLKTKGLNQQQIETVLDPYYHFKKWEYEFINVLSSYKLANS